MIVIDNREKSDVITPLSKYLDAEKMEYEVARLDVGDFLVCADTGVVVCIEHKRIPDLIMSVKDGHLMQQCAAMLEHYEHVRLLISGPTMQAWKFGPLSIAPFRKYGQATYSTIDIRRVVGLLSQIQKAGVIVDWWPLTGEVGAYLRHIKISYERGEHDSITVRPRTIIFSRRDNLTETLERMGLPGVGTSKAEALAKAFPSLRAVANASVKELEGVSGIGLKTAEGIHKFFGDTNEVG